VTKLFAIDKSLKDYKLDDLAYLVTIDTETKLITKIEIDVSSVLQKIINPDAGFGEITRKHTFYFEDYNDVELSITDEMKTNN
jgi:hypothetical protein